MPAGYKLTTKEVQERIAKIHGDLIVLDDNTYVNTSTKCRFIDKDYGEFWATPKDIMSGRGHKERGIKNRISKRRCPVDKVVERLREIHDDRITLDASTYVSMMIKCRFIDKDYGEWWATPSNIINNKQGHFLRGLEKKDETCMERYGTIHPAESDLIKEKSAQTNLRKRGVKYPMQKPDVQEKSKKTNLAKLGVEFPLQSSVCKMRTKETLLRRFGVDSPLKNKTLLIKFEQTHLERYGVKYPSQNLEIKAKIAKTLFDHYGVKHPSQSRELMLKGAKSSNNSHTLNHWKTGEDIVCVGSYEVKTINYLNANRIEYDWQPQVFKMPANDNGKVCTYRPDLYLPEGHLWVEIKGYFRNDAQEKWNWFRSMHRNSELWDKTKLKEFGIL